MSEKYIFSELPMKKTGPYILQIITNRKLTNRYHCHDFYEIVLVFEGECEQLINQKKVIQAVNEAIVLRPGDEHKFISQSPQTKVLSLSVLKQEIILLANAIDSRVADCLETEENCRFLLNEFRANEIVTKALNSVTSDEAILDYKVILFLFLTLFWRNTKREHSCVPNKLRFAFREMRKEENLKAGMPFFLELTGYSYSHLSRLMKRYVNMTPHQYLLELKLDIAYRHIIGTDELLEDIAGDIGFESYGHFIKIFKKRYGMTPAALRRRNGTGVV